jgi:hypothetical protein
MEWLLGGLSVGWFIDDPKRDFSNEDFDALPPLLYYQHHRFGPCLPSPTPSNEDPVHFAPPCYDPLPEMKEEEIDVAASARVVLALPDLNYLAPDVKEKAEDTVSSTALLTPSSEARVLLCRFTSAMAASAARLGPWRSSASHGLIDHLGALHLDDLPEGTSRRCVTDHGHRREAGQRRLENWEKMRPYPLLPFPF